ncbi:hypothetical protein FJY63_10545 [Candidatus Sumerlaeota bacterium]|nr:hypothetical protein [Candidatus Sumerlaeota bacterium]
MHRRDAESAEKNSAHRPLRLGGEVVLLRLLKLVVVIVLVATPAWLRGESAPGRDATAPRSSTPSFETFGIVVSRNIFDADRRGPVLARPVERPPDERIALVGCLINRASTATEIIAFFEGSKQEYEKTAKPGDTIAEWRITQVRTDGVSLEKEGRKMALPVGSGLSRPADGGEWQMVAAVASSAGRQSSAGSGETARTSDRSRGDRDRTYDRSRGERYRTSDRSRTGDTTGAQAGAESPATAERQEGDSGGADAGDVLKRLMERRRQETGR